MAKVTLKELESITDPQGSLFNSDSDHIDILSIPFSAFEKEQIQASLKSAEESSLQTDLLKEANLIASNALLEADEAREDARNAWRVAITANIIAIIAVVISIRAQIRESIIFIRSLVT